MQKNNSSSLLIFKKNIKFNKGSLVAGSHLSLSLKTWLPNLSIVNTEFTIPNFNDIVKRSMSKIYYFTSACNITNTRIMSKINFATIDVIMQQSIN